MGITTILWTLAAGVSLTLVAACGAVWLVNRRDPASAMLCCLGIAVAACAYFELRMMHAATPAEYGALLRWYHLPIFLAMTSQILFVRFYLGTGRDWLLAVVILMRALILIVNFTLAPNFNFASITTLHQVPLFGEQVTAIGTAVARLGWQRFATVGLLLWTVYLVDAAVQGWRMPDRESKRKALAIALGVALPRVLTLIAYSQLLTFGILRMPLTNLPWFLGALIVMAVELGRDFVVSRRALDQMAELQSRLARAERISILGQLAAALIHELAQPLAANIVNARVALMALEQRPDDRQTLQEIFGDIDDCSRRSAEVLTRMRQFIKLRAIAMQPLRVEEVVNDVASMVRPDAISNGVTLSLLMPPNLPRALGDRVHLSQVLLNLMMNSIHATQSRPFDARRVTVEARTEDGDVQVEVRDSGPGISEDVAERLFMPFFTTKPEGMGMGLALSRSIIEAHGGRLWAERLSGRDGATFCFTLRQA